MDLRGRPRGGGLGTRQVRRARALAVIMLLAASFLLLRALQGLEEPTPVPILVEVAGEVPWPGLYPLPEGAPVSDALALAGAGDEPPAAGADPVLARPLTHGARVVLGGDGVIEVLPARERLLLGLQVDINEADAEVLQTLPGVGPSRAAAILAEREDGGPFTHTADLERVRGIGPATAETLAPFLDLPHQGPAAEAGGVELPDRPPPPRAGPGAWWPLDPNRASAASLERLPGIGPVKAAAVVAHREQHGPFESLEDLLQVNGIGPATLHRMTPYLRVEAPAPESP